MQQTKPKHRNDRHTIPTGRESKFLQPLHRAWQQTFVNKVAVDYAIVGIPIFLHVRNK